MNFLKHHFLLFSLLSIFSITSVIAQETNNIRRQWNEEQAWEWENRIGIIKGFNAPSIPFPGMERIEILKKAASLG